MASIASKANLPLGIKIISLLLGFNAIVALGALAMRFFKPYSIDAKELTIRCLMFAVGALFFILSINLKNKKNWARLTIMVILGFILLVMVYSLIKTKTFPDPIHWWHFYLYPILLIYLSLPKIKAVFIKSVSSEK